jgi:hypothetical protein
MDRVAVIVDVGYLFAQGSRRIAGEKLPDDLTGESVAVRPEWCATGRLLEKSARPERMIRV